MNLLEHYIKEIISVEDVTKEWEKYMQEKDPNFIETNPMLEVKMLVNCYGNIEETIKRLHRA